MANKTERFAVRLTAEQDSLIRRAAEVEGTDLTNFTVTATLARPAKCLPIADCSCSMTRPGRSSWTCWTGRCRASRRLEKLFSEPSVFDAQE